MHWFSHIGYLFTTSHFLQVNSFSFSYRLCLFDLIFSFGFFFSLASFALNPLRHFARYFTDLSFFPFDQILTFSLCSNRFFLLFVCTFVNFRPPFLYLFVCFYFFLFEIIRQSETFIKSHIERSFFFCLFLRTIIFIQFPLCPF